MAFLLFSDLSTLYQQLIYHGFTAKWISNNKVSLNKRDFAGKSINVIFEFVYNFVIFELSELYHKPQQEGSELSLGPSDKEEALLGTHLSFANRPFSMFFGFCF